MLKWAAELPGSCRGSVWRWLRCLEQTSTGVGSLALVWHHQIVLDAFFGGFRHLMLETLKFFCRHNCCKPLPKTSTCFEQGLVKRPSVFLLTFAIKISHGLTLQMCTSSIRLFFFASILNRTEHLECCKSVMDKSVARVWPMTVLLKFCAGDNANSKCIVSKRK